MACEDANGGGFLHRCICEVRHWDVYTTHDVTSTRTTRSPHRDRRPLDVRGDTLTSHTENQLTGGLLASDGLGDRHGSNKEYSPYYKNNKDIPTEEPPWLVMRSPRVHAVVSGSVLAALGVASLVILRRLWRQRQEQQDAALRDADAAAHASGSSDANAAAVITSCDAPPPALVPLNAAAATSSTPAARPRPKGVTLTRARTSVRMSTDNRKLIESAPFSPALAHHELAHSVPADLTRPSAWEFEAALVFIDISGFTNLCTRLDIDTLQRHINQYFGELIGVVTSNGGDVLRFAGDALFCSWSLQKGAGETTALATATRAACRCVLELTRRCGTYAIPEIQAELSIHTGIGAGALCAYRVGTPNRWELLIAGGPLQQVAAAEGCAALGEAVCSAEAWALTEGRFAGEAVPGGGGCMRLLTRARRTRRTRRARFGRSGSGRRATRYSSRATPFRCSRKG